MPDNIVTIEIGVDTDEMIAKLALAKDALKSATAEMTALTTETSAASDETKTALLAQLEAAAVRIAAYRSQVRLLNDEMAQLTPLTEKTAGAFAVLPQHAESTGVSAKGDGKQDGAAREKREAYELAVATYQADAAQYGQASAERTAILRQELATAASFWGAGSKQYEDMLKQVNAADRAASTQEQSAMLESTNQFIKNRSQDLQAGIQHDRQLAEQHQLSSADAVLLETKLTNDIYGQELKRLDLDIGLLDEGTEAWRKATNERAALVQQQYDQIDKITDRAAAEQIKQQKQVEQEIVRSGTQTVTGLITGRQSLLQAVDSLAERGLEKAVEYGLRELVEHSGIASARVTVTAASQEAEVAAKAAGTAEGHTIEAAAGSTTVMGNAAKAFSGAYSAVAGIPIIGPILAPIAGATAFAAVAAYDVFSAEGGMASVPYDGAMIRGHAREMVLPASIATPLRDSIASGALTGAGDSGRHFHVDMSGSSFGAGVQPNQLKAAVVAAIKQAHREGAFA